MAIQILSLIALVVAIVIGILKPKINIGIVAIAFAMIVGYFFAGLKEKEIAASFPSSLFLMLVGITVLFGVANKNGTLDKLVQYLVAGAKGNTKLLPLYFFALTFFLSAIGPGNIAATALLAPIGMVVAYRMGISSLLMAIMICTGANAGAFSPVAPTGIISIGLTQKIGVEDYSVAFIVFAASALIQSLSALAAYFIFKGYKGNKDQVKEELYKSQKREKFTPKQIITMIFIFVLVVMVMVFKIPICIGAFTLGVLLLVIESADADEVIKNLPWDAILLVTGISVLIGVMEKSGGLELATSAIARLSSLGTINAVLSFITGVISAYSSSSGVVMPAFIPLIPGLIEKLGGGNIVNMIISIAVGSHMVDVSPLSTLGALCIASSLDKEGKGKLFKNLMIWGLSMAVVGAFLSYLFLDRNILGLF